MSEATGFCRSTVYCVLHQQKQLGPKKFESPVKRYVNSRKSICVDDFGVVAMRRTVHEFYNQKEYPSYHDQIACCAEREGTVFRWMVLCGNYSGK